MRPQLVRLFLLRHGEPVRRDLFYGHHDVALSERGHVQARAQGRALADRGIVGVYASDLSRATIGAAHVAEPHGLLPVCTPALREMHLGVLENVPYADGLREHPQLAGRSYLDMLDFAMPGGGESVRDVAARCLPVIEAAVVRHAGPDRPGVVVYAHNTVTRLTLGQAVGLGPAGYARFEQRYGAINRVDVAVVDGAVDWRRTAIAYTNRDPHWRHVASG